MSAPPHPSLRESSAALTKDALAKEAARGRPSRGQRGARCIHCRVRLTCCVCDVLPSLTSPSPLHFIVDPEEERRTTNTGWLARAATQGVWQVGRPAAVPPDAMVLFPSSTRVLSPADAGRPLIVVDSTWRRAKAHVRSAPLLHLPHAALPPSAPSRYQLRHGRRAGRMCTLEAVALALEALGAHAEGQALHRLLDTFIERTLALRAGKAPMLPGIQTVQSESAPRSAPDTAPSPDPHQMT